MTEAIIVTALCGVIGAIAGSRAAYPLLASLGLCQALPSLGFDFNLWFWLGVDFAVIAAILMFARDFRGYVIIALFLPAWGFYFVEPDARYIGTLAVVFLQMAFTIPPAEFSKRARRAKGLRDKWNEFDLQRVAG